MMKTKDINTVEDAERYCEGIINDFQAGICDKSEFMSNMALYTGRIIMMAQQQNKKDHKHIDVEVLKQAIDHFGEKNQTLKIAEECGELNVSLLKYSTHYMQKKNQTYLLQDVLQEIADVKIMLAQADLIFGPHQSDLFVLQKMQDLEKLLLNKTKKNEIPTDIGND